MSRLARKNLDCRVSNFYDDFSDTETELASSKLEDLSLLDTTPTHLHSATQEEISFTRDQLCKDAIAKLNSIRATYLASMSGSEKQVMESRYKR